MVEFEGRKKRLLKRIKKEVEEDGAVKSLRSVSKRNYNKQHDSPPVRDKPFRDENANPLRNFSSSKSREGSAHKKHTPLRRKSDTSIERLGRNLKKETGAPSTLPGRQTY